LCIYILVVYKEKNGEVIEEREREREREVGE